MDAAVTAWSPALGRTLRMLAVARHRAGDVESARALVGECLAGALGGGHRIAGAKALKTLGKLRLEAGAFDEARDLLTRALKLSGGDHQLTARISGNLGAIARHLGDPAAARAHHLHALETFAHAGDERGAALAHLDLLQVCTETGHLEEALRNALRANVIADRVGDPDLQARARLAESRVHLAVGSFDQASAAAHRAQLGFAAVGAPAGQADARRILGAVHRETRRYEEAKSELEGAVAAARQGGSTSGEAEAVRELALLYRAMGRPQDALTNLYRAHELFRRAGSLADQLEIHDRLRLLEDTYLRVVRDWGQSIESVDSYTFGHCGRVAHFAVAIGGALGLDPHQIQTIRVGAYLHDLGKTRVPKAILAKPGSLTDEELGVIRMHPVWGDEMLVGIEFPWNIRPLVRSHHERIDGTGYPDGLSGDEVPVLAQVIGIADVWDALTSNRSYRAPMTPPAALETTLAIRHHWRAEVVAAFLEAMPTF